MKIPMSASLRNGSSDLDRLVAFYVETDIKLASRSKEAHFRFLCINNGLSGYEPAIQSCWRTRGVRLLLR